MSNNSERVQILSKTRPPQYRATTPATSSKVSAAPKPHRRWPCFVWVLLKLVGLFNQPTAVTRRLCAYCLLSEAKRRYAADSRVVNHLYPGGPVGDNDFPDDPEKRSTPESEDAGGQGEAPTEEPSKGCVVCQSYWWDDRGRCRPYSEADIGVKQWNYHGSVAVCVVWQILLILSSICEFVFYFAKYWGKIEREFDLITYMGFMSFNMSVPALCLTVNIINTVPWLRADRYSWSCALSIRNIIKRLQHTGLGDRGLPNKAFLLACIGWPLVNSIWRIILYVNVFHFNELRTSVALGTSTVCLVIWGMFCYLMGLIRLSFKKQFLLEVRFLRSNYNNLDRCRRRLATSMAEFESFSGLVWIWITFTVVVSTWMIATQFYYDYAHPVQTKNGTTCDQRFCTGSDLDKLIWSQNLMFLALPLVAAGGFNLNALWARLLRDISNLRLRGERFDELCDNILAHCTENVHVQSVKIETLLATAIGFCLAVEFKEHDDSNLELY